MHYYYTGARATLKGGHITNSMVPSSTYEGIFFDNFFLLSSREEKLTNSAYTSNLNKKKRTMGRSVS